MRAALRQAKNAAMSYDPIEVNVREATSNDPWEANQATMNEIADCSEDPLKYAKMFAMLWKRLQDYQHHMHVHKALFLIEFLIGHGSDRFVQDCQRKSADIDRIRRYKYYNSDNVDVAGEVRRKAKAIFDLLKDEKRLAEHREKYRGDGHTKTRTSAPAPAPRRERPRTEDRSGDPYDQYSATSKSYADEERTVEERRRQEEEAAAAAKREREAPAAKPAATKKKSVSAAATPAKADDPFDAPAEDPFAEKPAAAAAKPKVKKAPSTEAAAPAAVKVAPPAQTKKKGAAKEAGFDQDPFAESSDPFAGATETRHKNAADQFLEDALASGTAGSGKRSGVADVDFITGQVEKTGFEDDDHAQGAGTVAWFDGDDDDLEEAERQDESTGGADLWASGLVNLDGTGSAKKKETKKAPVSMNQMQQAKGTVINIDLGGDFKAANPGLARKQSVPSVGAPAPFAPMQGQAAPMGYGMPMPGVGYGAPAYGMQPMQPMMPGYGMQPGFQQPYGMPQQQQQQQARPPVGFDMFAPAPRAGSFSAPAGAPRPGGAPDPFANLLH